MRFRHRQHSVPQLNTTSTADISFMLLIFFLVTTNMDVDKGLARQLPPPERQERQESVVDKGTMLELTLTADNRLLADGRPMPVSQLRARVEAFVTQVGPGTSSRCRRIPRPATTSISRCRTRWRRPIDGCATPRPTVSTAAAMQSSHPNNATT